MHPKLRYKIPHIILIIIIIFSLFISSVLQFQNNTWLLIIIFLIVFGFSLNIFLKKYAEETDLTAKLITTSENYSSKTQYQYLKRAFIQATLFSLVTLPISHAICALYTHYFGQQQTILLEGQTIKPLFSLSRQPCHNQLNFPKSEWSRLNLICLDHQFSPPKTIGFYQLTIKKSIFGANILHYQWVDDKISPEQRLLSDPNIRRLFEIYAKFERELGPPIEQ